VRAAQRAAQAYAKERAASLHQYAQAGVHPETAHAWARLNAQEAVARTLANDGDRSGADRTDSPMRAALRRAGLVK